MENGMRIIGVYPLFNTGGICVHAIEDESVLASMNGKDPEWTDIRDEYNEETNELEPGFFFGSIFVPLSDVMRV